MPLKGVPMRCALYGVDPIVDLDPISWLAREGGRSIFDITYSDAVQNVVNDNVTADALVSRSSPVNRCWRFLLAMLNNNI